MRAWVQRQLEELGELNSVCCPRLNKLLRETNGQSGGLCGTAIFAAYDPWDTCLRVVPKSFNYLRAAEKEGLVNFEDSTAISLALLKCCAYLQQRYRNGHFSYFFELPEIKLFMACVHDEGSLSDTENTRGTCADVFYGAVPWPLRPRRHLMSRTLPQISFQPTTTEAEPFIAVTDAIEYASWGTWIGLTVTDVCKILSHLRSSGSPSPSQSYVLQGRKMTMPFFSQGFQGVVVGFFSGIDDDQAELVRTTLLQFGQTLADRWSLQRCRYFWECVRKQSEPKLLAQAILQLVSPVSHLLVDVGGEMEGYQLKEEESYWAGYRKLTPNEMSSLRNRPAEIRLENSIFPGCSVIIKLLSEYPMLDKEFTKARIDMLLSNPFELELRPQKSCLSLQVLKVKQASLESRLHDGNVSIAIWRQMFVVEKMIKHYASGRIAASNHELLRYLETKISKIPSGYQISSHSEDIEKLLGSDIVIHRSRNAIQIQWTPE